MRSLAERLRFLGARIKNRESGSIKDARRIIESGGIVTAQDRSQFLKDEITRRTAPYVGISRFGGDTTNYAKLVEVTKQIHEGFQDLPLSVQNHLVFEAAKEKLRERS